MSNITCQAKVSTLEVNEEEDDTTLDFSAKDTDVDVVMKALSIEHFSVHAALKGMSYEKMKVLNDNTQSAKEGIRIIEMFVKMVPDMIAAEEVPYCINCHFCHGGVVTKMSVS